MRALAVIVGVGLSLAIALGAGVANAQPQHMDLQQFPTGPADKPPEILLLTFGEGTQIFEKFGHGALCIHSPGDTVDPERFAHLPPRILALFAKIPEQLGFPAAELPRIACVNYGVTNFREGAAMVWHFLRTEQKFWADTESMFSMIVFYSGNDSLGHQLQEDRDIWVQKLSLQPDQARAIETALKDSLEDADHQPCTDHEAPGCYYYYDHFFNNCTTRLRDMMDDATGGKLAGSDSKSIEYPLTFREVGRRGLAELPPLIAVADFVAGRQVDDTPTLWQAMFHPDVLRQQVELKLGVKPVLIYQRQGPPFPQDGAAVAWRLLLLAIGLAFGVPLALARWRRPGSRLEKAALIWATFYLVLWGLVIYGLVAISSIPGVRWNEAVFVLTPLDVALPLLGEARRIRYARIRVLGLVAVSLLCAIGVFHQPLSIPILCAFVPLAAVGFIAGRARRT